MPKKLKHTTKPRQDSRPVIVGIIVSLIGVVLVGIVILGVSLYGIPPDIETRPGKLGRELEQFQAGPPGNGFFSLAQLSFPATVDQPVRVQAALSTQGDQVESADLILTYDPTEISVESITVGSVFDNYYNTTIDSATGTVTVRADNNSGAPFDGSGVFATLVVTPLQEQILTMSVDCTPGASDDTNLPFNGEDLIDCDQNVDLVLDLVPPTATPSPTVTVSPSPSASATPGVTATPTGSATPTATATVTPSPTPTLAPGCVKPDVPSDFTAVTLNGLGQVRLTWTKAKNASYYAIAYGTSWNTYTYGSPNVGNVNAYVVTGLRPGTLYYFVVTSANDCSASGFTDPKAAYAGRGGGGISVATPVPTTQPVGAVTARPVAEATSTPTPKADSGSKTGFAAIVDEDWDSIYKSGVSNKDADAAAKAGVTPGTSGVVQFVKNNLPWLALGLLLILAGALILYNRHLKEEFDYYERDLDS